jgi:hypothetical protein
LHHQISPIGAVIGDKVIIHDLGVMKREQVVVQNIWSFTQQDTRDFHGWPTAKKAEGK